VHAARHHHMMMGHLHPGYLGYASMPPHAGAYGMHGYPIHHEQAMAHVVPHPDYSALQRPGSASMDPSARDPYGNAVKGGKDAGKGALHMHNPYVGLDMSRMGGGGNKPLAPVAGKAPMSKGPAGKAKCKPPRASGLGTSMSKGKGSGGAASARDASGGGGDVKSVLGATKGHRGTRVVQGKLVPVEGLRLESPQQLQGVSSGNSLACAQAGRGEFSQAQYLEEHLASKSMDESPGFSMLTITSPAVTSELTLSPMTHYVLAPLSAEKGPQKCDSTRLCPEATPGSGAPREVLPGAQWFLSPLLQSKDSPSNVWRNSPFMQSNFSPQVSPMMTAFDQTSGAKRKMPSPFISYATTSNGVVQLTPSSSSKRAKGADGKTEGRLSLFSSDPDAPSKAEEEELGSGGAAYGQGGEPSPTLSMISCGSMSAFALGVASGNGGRALDMQAKDEATSSCAGIIDQAVAAVDT
jgi:hypothetical protein